MPVSVDITKLILAEEEISNYAKEVENQRDTLEELNATKDRFFAIIAHDLKNPFGALHSIIDTLHVGYSNFDDEEKVFYIEHIKTIANRIYNLLDNLLLWATSQTGRISFQPEVFDVSKLIKENINLALPRALKKRIQFFEIVEEGLAILADKNMINTVLRNLTSNALKYSYHGGKVKIKAISLKTDDDKCYVKISVRDNGVGIDKETIEKLFRIDQNPSTKGTDDEKGSGLGLVLCKDFVETNGGKIWVESQVDEGSTFTFTIPQVKKGNGKVV